MKPDDFIATIRPGADECEAEYGIPAAFTIAQGALESEWGGSESCIQANNLFGVKADHFWKGPTISMQTEEVIRGKKVIVPAKWRKYDSWAESLLDHAKFFKVNPRYAAALVYPHDAKKFAFEIAKAGYATDPDYYKKLVSVMRSHKL
ncbi:MAG: glucosaminidase domain-containing protein [Sulfuriferula sp.]